VPRRPARRATLKAVAELAGVSPITVSNFVNGRYTSMSAETRERVGAAVAKLNYRVNLAARGLRRARHFCVALIVVDERDNFLSHPAHHQVAAGMSNVLNQAGYALAIEGVKPANVADATYLDRLSVDGLCLVASGALPDRKAVLERFRATRQPLIVFHDPPLDDDDRTCHVRSDDRRAGVLLGAHVAARGARQVVLLLPTREWASMNERALGVNEALNAVRGKCRIVHAEGLSPPAVATALDRHTKRYGIPEALIAGNELLAASAQRYYIGQGVRVPEKLLVCGFGGNYLGQYLTPPIVAVRIPSYEMGQVGAREMLAAIDGKPFSSHDIVLPVKLLDGAP
jgi:DNA-binding LacI/PurR family transcriptional regulator